MEVPHGARVAIYFLAGLFLLWLWPRLPEMALVCVVGGVILAFIGMVISRTYRPDPEAPVLPLNPIVILYRALQGLAFVIALVAAALAATAALAVVVGAAAGIVYLAVRLIEVAFFA